MGVAKVGDQVVNVAGLVGAGGRLAHLGQAAGRVAVVLGVGFFELIVDETSEDRQDREGVDLLVRLGQVTPGPVVLEPERARKVPGEGNAAPVDEDGQRRNRSNRASSSRLGWRSASSSHQ